MCNGKEEEVTKIPRTSFSIYMRGIWASLSLGAIFTKRATATVFLKTKYTVAQALKTGKR